MQTQLTCVVCGQLVQGHSPAYLVSINSRTQWLRVQHWDRKLANAGGMRSVCQAAHVVELAALWVATGSLNLDFAQTGRARVQQTKVKAVASKRRYAHPSPLQPFLVLELSIDQSSARRALEADSGPLVRCLEALREALRRNELGGESAESIIPTELPWNLEERKLRPSCAPTVLLSDPCERLQ